MKIAVMGSGGVGGYFGGRLMKGGADVTFVARGAHLKALRDHGLAVTGEAHAFHLAKVKAVNDPALIGPVDLILFAVKLWDSAGAIEQIRPIVAPGTAVMSLQNGVLKDDPLIEAFGLERIMGGVCYVASSIARPGVIARTGTLERLIFGEFDGRRSERTERLLDACRRAGIAAELSADIRRDIWEKFVFLVGLSGTTATMRSTIAAIRGHPQTRAFLRDVMGEAVAVARARGIALADDFADARLKLADSLAGDMTSSMHHDLERGNRLEVRWFSGAVVELGRLAGVPTPLNRAIADILALYADGRFSHEDNRHREGDDGHLVGE